MHLFVTGTDTGVGKTYIAARLVAALRRAGRAAVGFKPVACGDRLDAEALMAAGAPGVSLDVVNPVWFRSPAAPLAASMIENRPVDAGRIRSAWSALVSRFDDVIIEGAGGWETPLREGETMADLAGEFAAPVLIVVNNRLGALNHTILTVNAVRGRGLRCAGIVLNHVDSERDSASITNRAVLERMLPDIPIVAEVIHGEEVVSPWWE